MSSSSLESQLSQPAIDLTKSLRQDFDHDPGSHELAQFVHPGSSLVAPVRAVETPREIRVDLGTFPLWFLAMSLAAPLAASVWYWCGELPHKIAALAIALVAVPAMFAVVVFMNRQNRAFGAFCVVDLVNLRLELPRLGLYLSKQQVLRFVEFRGWRDTSPPTAPNTDQEWSRELSVIVKNNQGSFSRYQVVLGEGWPVSRFGKRLAELFGVELIVIKGKWF